MRRIKKKDNVVVVFPRRHDAIQIRLFKNVSAGPVCKEDIEEDFCDQVTARRDTSYNERRRLNFAGRGSQICRHTMKMGCSLTPRKKKKKKKNHIELNGKVNYLRELSRKPWYTVNAGWGGGG